MAFTFSLTPGDILNSNDRSLHWGAKARRAKALRQRAAIAWRLAGSPQMSRARLLVTVTYPTGHRRDVANLQATVKPLVDGMVHPFPGVRGLLPDDDDDHLIGPDMRHILPNTPGRYVLTLDFEEVLCDECHREHPQGKRHCEICGRPSAFIQDNGRCLSPACREAKK